MKSIKIIVILPLLLLLPASVIADSLKDSIALDVKGINTSESSSKAQYLQIRERDKIIVSYVKQLNANNIQYTQDELKFINSSLNEIKSNTNLITAESKVIDTDIVNFYSYTSKGNMQSALTTLEQTELSMQERGLKLNITLKLCNSVITVLQSGKSTKQVIDKSNMNGGFVPSNKGVITLPDGK